MWKQYRLYKPNSVKCGIKPKQMKRKVWVDLLGGYAQFGCQTTKFSKITVYPFEKKKMRNNIRCITLYTIHNGEKHILTSPHYIMLNWFDIIIEYIFDFIKTIKVKFKFSSNIFEIELSRKNK